MPKRRELIRMSDDEIDDFLHGRRTMNVAMWYGFYEGKLAFETFAKSQKVLNVQRDPRITILIEDGDQYEELRGVEIVGKARVVEDPADVMEIARDVVRRYIEIDKPEDVDGVAAAMANKRFGIVIEAERVVSWDHTKLGGLY
jgi:nitroimidazol reductase NimA-like FMN-containing flavoprotein (pyridoxamine 5'-phosphate oxidase superfamily)